MDDSANVHKVTYSAQDAEVQEHHFALPSANHMPVPNAATTTAASAVNPFADALSRLLSPLLLLVVPLLPLRPSAAHQGMMLRAGSTKLRCCHSS